MAYYFRSLFAGFGVDQLNTEFSSQWRRGRRGPNDCSGDRIWLNLYSRTPCSAVGSYAELNLSEEWIEYQGSAGSEPVEPSHPVSIHIETDFGPRYAPSDCPLRVTNLGYERVSALATEVVHNEIAGEPTRRSVPRREECNEPPQ